MPLAVDAFLSVKYTLYEEPVGVIKVVVREMGVGIINSGSI